MRRVLKYGGILVGAAALLAAIAAGGFYAMQLHFNPDPPPANYTKPKTALEAQRQDLDYFRKLLAMDRAFSPAARVEEERAISDLEKSPAVLSHQAFAVRLMQIAALADNGHTHFRLFDPQRTQLFVPIRMTRFADGFYVMRAKAAYRDLLGGRVESIDGVPFDQVLTRLETLRGGQESFRRENASLFIEEQDLLFGLGIARYPEKSTWTVRVPSGELVFKPVVAERLPKDEDVAFGGRWTSPEPYPGMGPDWLAYSPSSGTLPISRQSMDRIFENAAIPGSCARYIRLQAITDSGDQKIAPFLDETTAWLKARPPCAVIVDLRVNGGGDYTNTWSFAHALPGLVANHGPIAVLTDPNTFSAAITTAAFLKEAGGRQVSIVGEPVGDRLAFFSEGNSGCLPNLKICETYETGKHDYHAPCTDWDVCYWLNWIYPVHVKTLAPDEFVPQNFADWNAGHDLAFERALARVSKR